MLKQFSEEGELVGYLKNSEQSIAYGQSGHFEQMESSQLKLDTLSPMTLNEAIITTETPMTSDIQIRPWEQMESPQLKLDTPSTMTLNDVNVTQKTPRTSDEQIGLLETDVSFRRHLELDTMSPTTSYDVNVMEETPMASYE